MEFSIKTAKKELKHMITQYLQKDTNGKYCVDVWQRLPVYIEGPAGVGKTQIVGEIAEEMNLGFVSYSLVHHTRQSMLGLPVVTSFTYEGQEIRDTQYTLSELLATVYKQVEEGKQEGILFLDEANCCSETIQPMLLSFLQTKVLGGRTLPEGWMIVLCGNPPRSIYNRSARAFDGALLDRLRVISLGLNHEEYLEYVFAKDFHCAIKYYLTLHLSECYVCQEKEERLQLVTYRSWENLSHALFAYEKLGLEVSASLINQYIKVDRIVEEFMQVYDIFMKDGESFQEIAELVFNSESEEIVLEQLKDKPLNMQFNYANSRFLVLEQNVKENYEIHNALQSLREWNQEYHSLSAFLYTENLPAKIHAAVKEICETNPKDHGTIAVSELHDQMTKELVENISLLTKQTIKFLKEMKRLKNKGLLIFYISTIRKSQMWAYVLRDVDDEELKQLLRLEESVA